jgi:hypothetical protein
MPILKVVKFSDVFAAFRGRQGVLHLIGRIVFEPFFYLKESKNNAWQKDDIVISKISS